MAQRIRLCGTNGAFQGQTWEADERLRAGRLATLEVVLDDSTVSRRHAEFCRTEQGWCVRDLGSTCGIFVNGARCPTDGHPLADGDVVQLGKVTLRVELDEPPIVVAAGRAPEQA